MYRSKYCWVWLLVTNWSSVYAHGMTLWAESLNEWVLVSAFDAEGMPLARGKVVVKNLGEHVIAVGEIGTEGHFVFRPEKKEGMLIEVEDNQPQGHRNEFWLSVDDFLESHRFMLENLAVKNSRASDNPSTDN